MKIVDARGTILVFPWNILNESCHGCRAGADDAACALPLGSRASRVKKTAPPLAAGSRAPNGRQSLTHLWLHVFGQSTTCLDLTFFFASVGTNYKGL